MCITWAGRWRQLSSCALYTHAQLHKLLQNSRFSCTGERMCISRKSADFDACLRLAGQQAPQATLTRTALLPSSKVKSSQRYTSSFCNNDEVYMQSKSGKYVNYSKMYFLHALHLWHCNMHVSLMLSRFRALLQNVACIHCLQCVMMSYVLLRGFLTS